MIEAGIVDAVEGAPAAVVPAAVGRVAVIPVAVVPAVDATKVAVRGRPVTGVRDVTMAVRRVSAPVGRVAPVVPLAPRTHRRQIGLRHTREHPADRAPSTKSLAPRRRRSTCVFSPSSRRWSASCDRCREQSGPIPFLILRRC